MRLDFSKLHGCGNDFVFINDMEGQIELSVGQVQALCDRHFGIGADGVILVRESPREECAAYMHYINSDGTLAGMCGNGVRCFAKFLVDHNLVASGAGSFVADTLSGPKPISFEVDQDNLMTRATVDMGAPEFDPALVPVALEATAVTPDGRPYVGQAKIDSPWGPFAFTCVSMGNPHAICFIDDWSKVDDALFADPSEKSLERLDIDKIGVFFECHQAFPQKANIEFVDVRPDGLHMRVFERGCGETLACGTGACATNVAACLTGRAGSQNDVILRGGVLHIVWDDAGHVMMTGPATQSFTGQVTC